MNALTKKLNSLLCIAFVLSLSACSSKPKLESDAIPPRVEQPGEAVNRQVYDDPFEGFNRRMYYFNAKADEYVILPVVSGYKAVMPDFAETGVSNFFSNLGEIPTFINAVLQFKLGVAGETLARFATNSTIGLAGFIDVATPIGLDKQNEDFGQTLGHWGVGPGPYLVLPFLGPSSVRDATGSLVDMAAYQATIDEFGMKDEEELFLNFLRSIDARANVPFRYYASGSAFEYERMRTLYMKYRELQIER
ncbi:VacJ family lipoprotein [Thalassotalea euphylliae]|uniref:MlaA family lipoprotein n=1 Tax=Thalassotalea euphylliae TaxID=1655234 RepID=UPI003630BC18